jgi:hypothetical protein
MLPRDDFIPNIVTGDESWFQQNYRALNDIRYQARTIPSGKLWEQFSGMPKGAYQLIFCPERKLTQFAMFRCTRNCNMHFVISI